MTHTEKEVVTSVVYTQCGIHNLCCEMGILLFILDIYIKIYRHHYIFSVKTGFAKLQTDRQTDRLFLHKKVIIDLLPYINACRI